MHSKTLWAWSELYSAFSLPAVEHIDKQEVTGVCIDSRKLQKGDIFFALPGDPGPRFQTSTPGSRDGHDFVEDAIKSGAAAIVVSQTMTIDTSGVVVFNVEDTLDALWMMARYARGRLGKDANVVAVTGSCGKTTFKEMMIALIDCYASEASYNNYLGVPLTLAKMPATTKNAVCEVGTNHPGEIKLLADLIQPTLAVVLNVLPAHIGFFDGMKALEKEKLSIAESLNDTGKFILLNTLDLGNSSWRGESILFGKKEESSKEQEGLEQFVISSFEEKEGIATIEHNRSDWTKRLTVPGGAEYRGVTLIAACAVAYTLECYPEDANTRMQNFRLPDGRGCEYQVKNINVIDDSYNANPHSVRCAIESMLKKEIKGRHIAILGDILELGSDEKKYHTDLLDICSELDGVICVGEIIQSLYRLLPANKQLACFKSVEDIDFKQFATMFAEGDNILLKGSRAMLYYKQCREKLIKALEEQS